MMRLPSIAITALLLGCDPQASESTTPAPALHAEVDRPRLEPSAPIESVAFGSCLDQTRPHPILGDIVGARPGALVLLGDNVYANAGSVGDLQRAYGALGDSPAYQRLAAAVPIVATWDDHDYGRDDVGAEYELKEASKTVMLDFFGEPSDSPRRARAGNYDAVTVGPPGQRVQIVLLDTRWFRDPLQAGGVNRRYVPHESSGPTILGEAQWAWLEEQLSQPADVRFLVSSIQLVVSEHGFESWGLFPAERARMFELIAKTRAGGVIIISGDRHRGELSCGFDAAVGYPLLELTASSLNRPNHNLEDNRFRLEGVPPVGDENFGLATLDWSERTVRLALHGIGGDARIETAVSLDALQAGRGKDGVPSCAAL
ncbi:MAG: alkaline phosphatase D family protein [Nannocystaceae bacterium]|nr:alkaline phosphatase family protein [bacterium]